MNIGDDLRLFGITPTGLKRECGLYRMADVKAMVDEGMPFPDDVAASVVLWMRRILDDMNRARRRINAELRRRSRSDASAFPSPVNGRIGHFGARKYAGDRIAVAIKGIEAGERIADVTRQCGLPRGYVSSMAAAWRWDRYWQAVEPPARGRRWYYLLERAAMEVRAPVPPAQVRPKADIGDDIGCLRLSPALENKLRNLGISEVGELCAMPRGGKLEGSRESMAIAEALRQVGLYLSRD